MMIKRNQYVLFGMILLVLAIVLNQVLVLHDFISGCLYGSSIGLLIWSIFKQKNGTCYFKSLHQKELRKDRIILIVN